MKTTMTDNITSTQTTVQTPSLPTLYFFKSNDELDTTPTRTGELKEETPSLQTLPSELVQTCLTKYADWGDLAKLACVQSKWKNVVEDAAEFGGRDATWELSMCLLHGDDKYDGSGVESAEGGDENDDDDDDDDENDGNNATNSRGLQKNEALAIKYLTRLSGVEIDEASPRLNSSTSSSEGEESGSILPGEWQSPRNDDDAETADEAAILELAACHLSGNGLPAPNPRLALRLLQSAYHLTNSVRSAHKLALLYEYPTQSNNLISVDIVAAFEWFEAAAQDGYVPSMAELALCYELGCGVSQSDEEALDWYTRAANAGHSASHYSVGEHFEEARGVRMDHEEACLWYYRAAVMGDEDGVGGLRRLEDQRWEEVFNA